MKHASPSGNFKSINWIRRRFSEIERIWYGDKKPSPQYRLFRKTIQNKLAISSAELFLFAEQSFHLWMNGTYLGRGPIFHHPKRLPINTFDLYPFWKKGKNLIAVEVQYSTTLRANSIPTNYPYLIACLKLTDKDGNKFFIETDSTWRVTDRTGKQPGTEKLGGVIGHLELYDSEQAPGYWQQPEFDDSKWEFAEKQTWSDSSCDNIWLESSTPPLKYYWQPVVCILGSYFVESQTNNDWESKLPNGLAEQLQNGLWELATGKSKINSPDIQTGSFSVKDIPAGKNVALVLDMGKGVCRADNFRV